MKITIYEDKNVTETEISIVCPQMTDEIKEIVSTIGLVNRTFAGRKGGEVYFIPVKDIYYFESVEGVVFFYTEREMYEATVKLYKIEESLQSFRFARVSKSAIVNLGKMQSIKKSKNSRLTATLANQEKIIVSRQYVPGIMRKMGV